MTLNALKPVLAKLARCRTATEVGGVAIDGIKQAFGVQLCAAVFLDDSLRVTEHAVFGARDEAFDEYQRHWRGMDSIFPLVMARAAPVYNLQVCQEAEWLREPAYLEFGKRHDIYHYMSAPIFGPCGTLAGVMNYCRGIRNVRFDTQTIDLANTFSGFVSATLARVTNPLAPPTDACDPTSGATRLTGRELQVAQLAAAGCNNVEIGLRFGIARETVKQTLRRVYSKLGVGGRAEMAAKLALHGLLAR
jgi:DNA-binding CsgD family transcriptional regulator